MVELTTVFTTLIQKITNLLPFDLRMSPISNDLKPLDLLPGTVNILLQISWLKHLLMELVIFVFEVNYVIPSLQGLGFFQGPWYFGCHK